LCTLSWLHRHQIHIEWQIAFMAAYKFRPQCNVKTLWDANFTPKRVVLWG
jgi:hypothetical protein